MRSPSHNHFWLCVSGIFLLVAGTPAGGCTAQAQAISSTPTVEIRQLHEVQQGGSGSFAVKIAPEASPIPVILRLRRFAGTGSATFEDGTIEHRLAKSEKVEVHGVVASDLAGGMALEAWIDGEGQPATSAFFDVIAAAPQPRIFWGGLDVTDTTQTVVVGQQVLLNVTLHPSLDIRSQGWTIEPQGEYVGGFVHTPTRGGPQPVTINGPTVTVYWVTPGPERKVTYHVTTSDGETALANVVFDVEGPSVLDLMVPPVQVTVRPGTAPDSFYMDFAGKGILFEAHFYLPEGLRRNYIWVQLVTRDVIRIRTGTEWLVCRPKSEPEAELSAGLDTDYPYDWRNPTRDSPPIELDPESEEVSRSFHARMYLLWGSGMPNSIAVPTGYVAWHFEGHAVRKDLLTKAWTLTNGSGGPDDPQQPFRRSRSYPSWSTVVPYSGLVECKH